MVPALRPPPVLPPPPPPKLPAALPPLEPTLLPPNEPLDWWVLLLLGEESKVEVRLGGGKVLRFTLLLVAVLLFTFVFDGVELILFLLWLVEVLPSLTLLLGLV